MKNAEVNVGVLIAYSPASDLEKLRDFSIRVTQDAGRQLYSATDTAWNFHTDDQTQISSEVPRRPSDFLEEASLRMVEGPFDIVVVITDVALYSRRRTIVAGLSSPASRIIVISTRKFLITPLGTPLRTLDAASVHLNAVKLLLHSIGHLLGMKHHSKEGNIMSPFFFDENIKEVPQFDKDELRQLKRLTDEVPETTLEGKGVLKTLLFHLSSAARNYNLIFWSIWKNRALFLPLSLPRLATAALAPTFILVFSAEIWDVGLSMQNSLVFILAAVSILASVLYLTEVHSLFYPREEKQILTEHMAVVNVVVALTIFFGILGLFVMIGLLMLFIQMYIFPQQLINAWSTLEHPKVNFIDQARVAAFISTIGVLTGSLAGGLENRAVIRHLALFLNKP